MLRYRTSLLALCVGFGAAGPASAGNVDPFRDADPIHEIGLARLAAEAGDSALAAALGPNDAGDVPRERAVLAIRAAPFAAAPEQLIPALLELACGRDPNLAPEAASALQQIGEGLRPSELAAREVLNADLRRARDAVTTHRAKAKALRPDIALAIDAVAADLSALVGMKPE
jgi:hypothetical protein